MRRWLFLLGLFAVPPALAQELPVETVVSDASAMAGLWRISRPDVISVAEKAPPLLGPLRESFCRIEAQPDGVAMHCMRRRLVRRLCLQVGQSYCFRSRAATSSAPCSAARVAAVLPEASAKEASAPCLRRTLTASVRPVRAANMRAVWPLRLR